MDDRARRRHDRMLEALPRVWHLQPEGSVLRRLLAALAEELAALDALQVRALHDRWLGLAGGAAGPAGSNPPSALEGLGALLATPRLPAEAPEPYRARLRATARALVDPDLVNPNGGGGPPTPRGLLALALADLGAEACPRARRRTAPHGPPWWVDATEALGVDPALRRRCQGCADRAAPCLAETEPGAVRARAAILESPPAPRATERDLAVGESFAVESRSFAADRPVVRLAALGPAPLAWPALENTGTGEILVFSGVLEPGEELVVEPAMRAEELAPFDDSAGTPHHAWAAEHPRGRARRGAEEVTQRLRLLAGARFDDDRAAFGGLSDADGARFADLAVAGGGLAATARTPRLRPGRDVWRLRLSAPPPNSFDSAVFGHDSGPDDAAATFAAPGAEDEATALLAALGAASEKPGGPPVARVALEWVARPPASFLLRLDRTAFVEAAEARGALDLLRADLALLRPAGVRAELEIRVPPLPREAAAVGAADDFGWRLAARLDPADEAAPPLGDAPPALAASFALAEAAVAEPVGGPLFGGVFGATRFDASTWRDWRGAAPRPGVFDATPQDGSLWQD